MEFRRKFGEEEVVGTGKDGMEVGTSVGRMGKLFHCKRQQKLAWGKGGETLGDVKESCQGHRTWLGAHWSGLESKAFDRAGKTEAGAQEHRVAELGGAWSWAGPR